ncbi:long-chain-fatty-acid--CoA ligase [Microbacterium sp.]|uniref:long-chain-fatty-acid--CoA ligase n=1 Tax=Microbacterium sp. TaxID=51671 RepID=UPI003A84D597
MIFHPQLTTLNETIAFHADHSSGRAATLTPDGDRLSYRELADRSARLAGALRRDGIVVGDRIACLGRETPAYWELLFACARVGAVLVPINPALAADEVAHIVADAGAALVLVDGDHRLAGRSGRAERCFDGREFARWRDDGMPDVDHAATPDTPVAQLYTSGTTGLPKGVVLGHRSFFAIRDALGHAGRDWIDWRDGDIAMIGIPGFHVGGLWYGTQAFHAGATVFTMPGFDAAVARRAIAEHQVTTAIVVPAMLRQLLDQPGGANDFATLRKVVYGGAPISESLLRRAGAGFGADFAQIYGLTETGNTAICLPPDQHGAHSTRLRAAGCPYPGVEVRVTDEDGTSVPTGQVGEVWLRTPAAMLEYWRMPDATAATLVDGWVRTGDAGRLDDEGYLFIEDRVKDMILVAGENVFPAEVENALAEHPSVADAAVIGIPDDDAGEAVLAYIVVEGEPPRTRDLALFLRDRLAPFKRPTRYEFVDAVPRNPSGKILRRALRGEHWAGRDRQVN